MMTMVELVWVRFERGYSTGQKIVVKNMVEWATVDWGQWRVMYWILLILQYCYLNCYTVMLQRTVHYSKPEHGCNPLGELAFFAVLNYIKDSVLMLQSTNCSSCLKYRSPDIVLVSSLHQIDIDDIFKLFSWLCVSSNSECKWEVS